MINVRKFASTKSLYRFLSHTLYSTQNLATNSSKEDGKLVGKFSLAESLAELVESPSSELGHKPVREGKEIVKMTLAEDLASLVHDSSEVDERKSKPRTRVEKKRIREMRIKKRVKECYVDGKYHELMAKVVADRSTLKDAYDCIRLGSNVDLGMDGDELDFEAMVEELATGKFDVGGNTYSIVSRGVKVKEKLVLPNLKLRVVQEAIRIVLDVVYRPYFSKVSHGFRNGRGHWSALKYIRKEIRDPDWWFTLQLDKKLDPCVLTRLMSSLEEKIDDSGLSSMIRTMFDVNVLNMEFGGYPKGHGLPQEGVLSPILMNVYLDLFDREFFRMSMRYETSSSGNGEEVQEDGSRSKLRGFIRRQINGNTASEDKVGENSGVRVHCCRYIDEIFISVSGSKEVAVAFKSEIEKYLRESLFLEVNRTDVLACNDPKGIQFVGTLIKRRLMETSAVRTVHKLKEKVKMFAEWKQESWDEGAVRIGKKWLAHGLKKVKESEIKQLADTSSVLYKISCYRKSGMETDHWYKVLLKIWMQDGNARYAKSEDEILAKHIVEPALPQELTDAYYEFQKRARDYVFSETTSTLALKSNFSSSDCRTVTGLIAPVDAVKKRLLRYGLASGEGYARPCKMLILLDDDQIVSWYSGIVQRWLRWYSECDNLSELKCIISDQIRMSCIRTLAVKYSIHEDDIERKFNDELSGIPSTAEVELEEVDGELISKESIFDDASMYGINNSGLCMVSLARKVSKSRPCNCFVMGCSVAASCVYTLSVQERQRFPGWKTGFSSSIHPSFHGRNMGLCNQHLKDLFVGNISLQSIDFGALR